MKLTLLNKPYEVGKTSTDVTSPSRSRQTQHRVPGKSSQSQAGTGRRQASLTAAGGPTAPVANGGR